MTYKVFLSNSNNHKLKLDITPGSTFTQLRLFLKEEFERETFLVKGFLEILINEKFVTDATRDSQNQYLKEID